MKTLATATLADLGNGLNAVLLHSQDESTKRTDSELTDLFIETLGKSRAEMGPAFGEFQPPIGKPVLLIDDPRVWYTETTERRPVITLRHPGFGFLSFALTQDSVDYLLQHLGQWKAASPDGSGAPR